MPCSLRPVGTTRPGDTSKTVRRGQTGTQHRRPPEPDHSPILTFEKGASLRTGLEAEGHAVDLAPDGREALWYAREKSYDVILLDIMLPFVNGYDVCRTLRDESNWTPVLMLSAKDRDWDQVEALDIGADDYVTKPFSFAVLLARMKSLVRRGAIERPVAMKVGDLEYDPARKTGLRAGKQVILTALELALLESSRSSTTWGTSTSK